MDANCGLGASWYAIWVRSKQEFHVRNQLSDRGIENFLPVVDRWRKWSDRKKLITFPLFPGYLFGHFDLKDSLEIVSIREVVDILGMAGRPVPILQEEIEAVRRVVDSPLAHEPEFHIPPGTPVEVIHGPLTGVRGIMVRNGKRTRLVISVNLIGQGAAVQMEASDLIPLKDLPKAS